MKRLMTAAFAVTLLAWGNGLAAQTTHTESETKRRGPGSNEKVETEIVSGQVKEYEAGKEIEIEGPGGKNHEFDLDENARVEGSIVVGQTATVHYTKENGKERVVVLAAGALRAPMAGGHPGHGAPAVKPGEKARMESTTERTGPGRNIKTKREVVVGTVKEYEAGKQIEVEGPSGKNHEFDLDEQVLVKGAIVKGQQVKVEYTKMDDGTERVVILAPMVGTKPDSRKVKE
ncbi:MAG: hypothetical protein ABR576_00850 [Thermoanaerobaculia bacterium]